MAELEQFRVQIDQIDRQIVPLYEARLNICEAVGEYKRAAAIQVLDKEREWDKIEQVKALAATEAARPEIAALYEYIMSASRKLQQQLVANQDKSGDCELVKAGFTRMVKVEDKMRVKELMIYKNFTNGDVLHDMSFLMDNYDNEYYNVEDMKGLLFDCVNELLELAGSHGFTGNLWHNYLTFLLANNENSYSMACEIRGPVKGTINQIVLHDFQIFKEYFAYDLHKLEVGLGTDCLSLLLNYENVNAKSKVFNKRIRDRICLLADNLGAADTKEDFQNIMTEFYKDFGVGKLGLHKAFRVAHNEEGAEIVPITNIAHVKLDDLVGYEIPKQKLIENTEAFVAGRKANNCLLFGDSGTGKSSSVKAILNQYYDQGLRMIEIYKHQFQDLNEVITQVKNRNYKFIIYMDDLSFEEFETEYKYLKAVIEGGLEKKPDNILIYATSNRRHLVREEFSDKDGRRDDLHASDTVQEKLSLYARFGVSIFFNGPSKKEYQRIVLSLAKRNGIEIEEDVLLLEANKWELSHGGLSGRTAQQFIDYLLGKKRLITSCANNLPSSVK